MKEFRSPPNSAESECIVLASFMVFEIDRAELLCIVSDHHFYHEQRSTLWSLLREMFVAGELIEPASVVEYASKSGQLEDIGGGKMIAEILEFGSSTPKHYARIVAKKWRQRELLNIGRQMIEDAYSELEPDEITQNVSTAILDLQTAGTSTGEVSLRDSIKQTFENLESKSKGDANSVMTGFSGIDDLLGGFRGGQSIVLAARPGVGKSALVANISANVSKAGGGVLFVSMEMSHIENTERLLSSEASVNGRLLTSGEFEQEHVDKLLVAAEPLLDLNFHYLDSAFDIEKIIATARAVHQRHGLSMLVVDYLQLCQVSGIGKAMREQEVAKMSRAFKMLAMQLDIPVVSLSQLNRGLESRTDKRPTLADLRESGAIEQDANVVLFLTRPEMHDPEDRPGQAELIVAKNRSGDTGICDLRFVKEYTRFEDLGETFYEGGL